MDGGNQDDVIYTDFEKAFDRVHHIILLRKLYELGIHKRSQAIIGGGCRSDFIEESSGIPQGSIFGAPSVCVICMI